MPGPLGDAGVSSEVSWSRQGILEVDPTDTHRLIITHSSATELLNLSRTCFCVIHTMMMDVPEELLHKTLPAYLGPR